MKCDIGAPDYVSVGCGMFRKYILIVIAKRGWAWRQKAHSL